ncbi:MAG: ParB/RepB/Spo0J family partition protein, partial [Oscillospiraceae bacterium]|nr:ParB/RepB/Spo0J family partition protein [Candidatus Equicaccousia limihippi]
MTRELLNLPLEDIICENTVRNGEDLNEISRLAQSIKENGLIQPLTVSAENGKYYLISGARRKRALENTGQKYAPCIVINTKGLENRIISLCDNLQRKNLSFFEEAQAIAAILQEYSMPYAELSKKLGLAPSTLCNKVRLLSLEKSLRDKIEKEGLSERQARALLILPEYKRSLALYK